MTGMEILNRINVAKEDPAYKSARSCWGTYIDYFEKGKAAATDPEFNLVYVFGSSLIPNLIFQNPYIMAVPQTRTPEGNRNSMLWESIDNTLVDLIGLKEEVERAVTFAYCTNIGLLEIGWDLTGDPINSLEKGTLFPRISRVDNRRRKNFPWVKALDPREVIFPAGFSDLRHIPWYAKCVTLPEYEVKKLPELKGKKIDYNYQSKEPILQDDRGTDKLEPINYLNFYIFRSVETSKVTWVTPEGKIIFEQEDPLQVDGLPLAGFIFNPAISNLFGSPDVSYIESQYLEGNELRRDGRWQRKNATLKLLYDTSMMSEADMGKFLSGEALPGIGVNVPPGKSLGDCVHEMQYHVQREYMEYAQFLIKDTEYLLGFGPNQMGTTASGRRTMFEMQQVAQNNLLRVSKRRDSVASCISSLFAKINLLVEKNWTQTETLPILGPEANIHYLQFKKEDLKGLSKIRSKVSTDSLAPSSVEKRKEDMKEIMGILAQFSPESASMLQPLIKHFISLFDWGEVRGILPTAVEQATSFNNMPTEVSKNPQGNLQGLAALMGPQQGNANAPLQPAN
jgi:hypothetical protein